MNFCGSYKLTCQLFTSFLLSFKLFELLHLQNIIKYDYSPVVQEKYPAKIPTQAYLVPSEAEFCLVYPKKSPHAQHFRDFFPVQKQNGRRTPLLKISKCNVQTKHLDPVHPI